MNTLSFTLDFDKHAMVFAVILIRCSELTIVSDSAISLQPRKTTWRYEISEIIKDTVCFIFISLANDFTH